MHVLADALRVQKRASDPLELQLKLFVSLLLWLLLAESKPSGRIVGALNP